MSDREYSLLYETESTRGRSASGRRRVDWSISPFQRAGHKGFGISRLKGLSNAEKAGVLGMVAVVVIIMGLVITSGGGADVDPLNPNSQASKVKRALDHGDSPADVVVVDNPRLTVDADRKNKAEALFAGTKWPANKSALGTEQKPPAAKKPAAKKSAPRTRKYRIKDGDILGTIAKRKLGRASRWPEIMKLNPGLDPKHLVPGTEIVLPSE